MNWKFWERETRQESSYGDAVLNILRANVEGTDQLEPGSTAAEIAARGLWSRAFAVADVTPWNNRTMGLTADVLALMAEGLFDHGQSVWGLEVMDGMIKVMRASDWDIEDDRYQLTYTSPDHIRTVYVRPESVLNLRISNPLRQPWDGSSPISGQAITSAHLLSALELRLREEVAMNVTHVMPVSGLDDTYEQVQRDINKAKSKTIMVETTQSTPLPSNASPKKDWESERLGADPPPALIQLRDSTANWIVAAAGVGPPLLALDSDATARREAYRMFLHTTVTPMAEVILVELREKLGVPDLRLTFDRLFAGDLQGRARAFQSMVGGGMPVEKAAQLSNLMEME